MACNKHYSSIIFCSIKPNSFVSLICFIFFPSLAFIFRRTLTSATISKVRASKWRLKVRGGKLSKLSKLVGGVNWAKIGCKGQTLAGVENIASWFWSKTVGWKCEAPFVINRGFINWASGVFVSIESGLVIIEFFSFS